MKVFVLNQSGKPLMPTTPRKARLLLRAGRASIAGRKPFTIQLHYPTPDKVQDITLGIDSGYETIGFSAVTEKAELIGGEVEMLKGQKERNKARTMYRRNRRSRKRHRRPAWRKSRKHKNFKQEGDRPAGWLAPSVQHKLDTHIRFIESLLAVMPVATIIIETASFDIQAIRHPGIAGVGYQTGEQAGFWNLREYILHRDKHDCQICKAKRKLGEQKNPNAILQVHHIGYWKPDRSDRPGNLITLCTKCHTAANHKPGKLLFGWEPPIPSFRAATLMSTVRWRLLDAFDAINVYGYQTKSTRIALGLAKSHHNDAFVIACGSTQPRAEATIVPQRRRNNRSLEKFYDAKYIDVRTGNKASGQELSSGRRKRNLDSDKNGANSRPYRGPKVSKGRRSIRRQRYSLQPGDIVLHDGVKRIVKGVCGRGRSLALYAADKKTQYVPTKNVSPLRMRNGLIWGAA